MSDYKVALVTGAAKRLGAAIVRDLHQHKFNVVIHYRNSSAAAKAMCHELNQIRPDSSFCVQADLAKTNEVKTLCDKATNKWGRVDVLVNNASSFSPSYLGETTEDKWDDIFASNSKAPFFISQYLTPTLKKNQGVIINMIDIHGDKPLKNHTVYSMAKSSLAMLTRALAKELAPDIRVNGISPGAILWPQLNSDTVVSQMIEQELNENSVSESQKKNVVSNIPLGRIGKVEDITKTVNFLLNAPYITGQIIVVDGGRSL